MLETAFKEGEAGIFTEKVESMTKADIDKIVGEVTNHYYDITKWGSLLNNNTYYWLASSNYSNWLERVIDTGSVYVNVYLSTNTSYGIRPKVSLPTGTANRDNP